MKYISILLTIFILTFSQEVVACKCGSEGEFLKVAPKSEFVALVKVIKYITFRNLYEKRIPMSMEVEIIDIYKGKEKRKTVTVWGDNGILCRPYLSLFDIGKYYVIAFEKGSDGSKGHVHENEKITDYSISICGEYWLKADIKKQVALALVTNKQSPIKLAYLKSKLLRK